MSRMIGKYHCVILVILLGCFISQGAAQVLLTLSVMDPAECKPIGGPGCKQAVPVTCDATNQGPEPVLLTKAQCRTLLAAEGLVATDQPLATAIWRQRAKDELWGKLARYATFPLARWGLVALAVWKGGTKVGLTTATGYEFLDQGAERAAARAPEIERNISDLDVDNVSVGVGETGTVTAWASAAQVKSLAYEQRTRYQWLAGGVPESMQPKTARAAPAVDHNILRQRRTTAPETPQDIGARKSRERRAVDMPFTPAHWSVLLAETQAQTSETSERNRQAELAWRTEYQRWEREQGVQMNEAEALELISGYELVAAK